MGFKTITFTNEIEKRTHVQGEFMGKYFGTLNHEKSASNFECYDIQIYQGEISNLKNEKEHPEIINETIYNAVVSETQLTQKSFENVLVNLEYVIKDYDSIKLAIKEPKLEAVQIYDVVKDTNQTFGTLTCLVSGYLLEIQTEKSELQVETCDGCGKYWKECTCEETTLTTSEKPLSNHTKDVEDVEETYWEKYFGFGRKENRTSNLNSFKPFSFGCLGIFGLLAGALLLISFGFPGILIGCIVFIIYALSSLTRLFPTLGRGWRQLLYVFLGLLLLDLSFNLFDTINRGKPSQVNPQVKTTPTENQQIDLYISNQDSNISNSNSEKEKVSTSAVQSVILGADSNTRHQINPSPDAPKSSSKLQDNAIKTVNKGDIFLEETINNLPQESDEAQNTETNIFPQRSAKGSNTDLNSEIQINKITRTEELVAAPKLYRELQNNDSNSSNQISSESQTQTPNRRQKQKKATEIISGIEFHEGNVFICKGDESKRYHFDASCIGLSNCSTPIYKINIPAAERLGRTLCKIEE